MRRSGHGGGSMGSTRFNPPVPRSHDLAALLAALPPGQRRVAEALMAEPAGRTYPQVAALLGVHLGTVHRHLARIRRRHPAAYRALLAVRADQLAGRHTRAVAGAKAQRARRRYIHRHLHGREPWER